jgi:hypothetical protein
LLFFRQKKFCSEKHTFVLREPEVCAIRKRGILPGFLPARMGIEIDIFSPAVRGSGLANVGCSLAREGCQARGKAARAVCAWHGQTRNAIITAENEKNPILPSKVLLYLG